MDNANDAAERSGAAATGEPDPEGAPTEEAQGKQAPFESIRYEVDGAVATITLDRPQVANAQDTRLIDELDAAFDLADADDDVRVVILAAEGRHFSSGHDLKALVGDVEPDEWRQLRETPEGKYRHEKVMYFDRCLKIYDFRKPTIAAVQGSCCLLYTSRCV